MIVGDSVELEIGAVGHGGVCVAHAPDGRVVLVRHALPGERVRAQISEAKKSFLRADAIEILAASGHRVAPPCPFAGPERCGGCDWQHVELGEQRRLKATVVETALQRIAGLERTVTVEPVPGDDDGLHWRTRMRLAVGPDGIAGLHRHRSDSIEPITDCLIAHPSLPVASVLEQRWPDVEAVDLQATDTPEAIGRSWRVPEGGFWQVHPGAPDVLVGAVLGYGGFRPADVCLDLYAGVGLFAGAIAPLVPDGEVVAVESHPDAAAAAAANLADLRNVTVVADRVSKWLKQSRPDVDVVVLDPPRKGAGLDVVEAMVALRPRAVVYVACEPSSLARDIAAFASHGWKLAELSAYDLFPMTAHVECVALLTPGCGGHGL
ncbi:MAG TPA: TRAM domain-containing protein [Mycobacteriales bacterium]|nr:TRAM domain-containing protein [Mycobacteriales bacterium]